MIIKSISWDGIDVTGWRALLVCLFFPLLGYRPSRKPSKAIVIGAIGYALMCTSFIVATKMTFVANVIVLQYGAPVYIALLSRAVLNEPVTRLHWLTLIFVMCGIGTFFFDQLGPGNLYGNLLAIGSGLAAASYPLTLRALRQANPNDVTFYGSLLMAGVFLPTMLDIDLRLEDIALILVLAFFQQTLSNYLYAEALRHLGALESTLITGLTPILSGLWAYLILREVPGRFSLIGGGIVLSSVLCYSIVSARVKMAVAVPTAGLAKIP